MLPLSLDLGRLKLALIGEGEKAVARLALLDAAGASDLLVYAVRPSPALARAAGKRLVRRLPEAAELAAAQLVFISERNAATARLAAAAREAGALLHVEDWPALSDLQSPAVLRRGALTIAVSTDGGSPGLAAEIKRFLGRLFGPEWAGRLDALAALRRDWRRSGDGPQSVSRRTAAWIAQSGWLPAESAGGRSGEPQKSFARSHC